MVNLENYEEYMLLEADGELNETERKELYAFLEQHPHLKKEMDAYKKAYLVPDAGLIYTNKEALLKSSGGGRVFSLNRMWMYGAAAALVVFLAISMLKRKPETENNGMAANIKTNTPVNNTTVPQTITTDTIKTLHSPVSPIVYETKKKATQVAKNKKSIPVPSPVVNKPVQQEVIVKKEKTPVKDVITPAPLPGATIDPEPAKQTKPLVAKTEEEAPAPTQEVANQKNKSILASLPIKEEKLEGIRNFSETVTAKVEQVRSIREKIKDSEITFKLGKKELFVVKL